MVRKYMKMVRSCYNDAILFLLMSLFKIKLISLILIEIDFTHVFPDKKKVVWKQSKPCICIPANRRTHFISVQCLFCELASSPAAVT